MTLQHIYIFFLYNLLLGVYITYTFYIALYIVAMTMFVIPKPIILFVRLSATMHGNGMTFSAET